MTDSLSTNTFIHGDCRAELQSIPDESIQLTITSPPYNIGKEYGSEYDDTQPIDHWVSLMEDVFEELFRVTKPDGKVCVNVGFSTGKTAEQGRFYRIPLNKYIIDIAHEVGFDMFDEYVWIKNTFASHGGGALFGSYPYPTNLMANQMHEYVLVFRKWVSDEYYQTRELPAPDSERKEKSEVTKDEWQKYTRSVWELEPVSSNEFGVDHDAMFPVELPYRLIKLYSFVDDVVLDPFMGVGTTAIAARKTNREYIGIEQNKEYVEASKKRLTGQLQRTIESRERAKKAIENAESHGQEQHGLDAFTE